MLRPVDEPLRLGEAESVIVGHVSDFYALLYAIDETMPKDSVLCLEGTAIASDVVAFLEQRPAPAPARIDPNTLWPKPKFFHLSLSGTHLTDLRALADHHAEPEVAKPSCGLSSGPGASLGARCGQRERRACILLGRANDRALPRGAR
jgi:hypothetical protein